MNDIEMLLLGEYFIGDLNCIFHKNFTTDYDVIDENDPDPEIGNLRENLYYIENSLNPNKEGGIFNIDNVSFYWYRAKKGRNEYTDNFHRKYPCDSGILICFPVSKLKQDEKDTLFNAVGNCCYIKNFQSNFGCFHTNGRITFGDVTIDTNIGEYDFE
jgi:hypothetical protein